MGAGELFLIFRGWPVRASSHEEVGGMGGSLRFLVTS